MPWQDNASWKGMGLNPGAGKGFFLLEISVKGYLYLAVEFILYKCELYKLSIVLCVCLAGVTSCEVF